MNQDAHICDKLFALGTPSDKQKLFQRMQQQLHQFNKLSKQSL